MMPRTELCLILVVSLTALLLVPLEGYASVSSKEVEYDGGTVTQIRSKRQARYGRLRPAFRLWGI